MNFGFFDSRALKAMALNKSVILPELLNVEIEPELFE